MKKLPIISLTACLLLVISLAFIVHISQKRTAIEQHAAGTQITFSGLKVSGNKLVNEQGQQVILHGVDRSGTEYQCVTGNQIFDGPNDAASIQAMKTWDIDVVRVPLNEDCWLGINNVVTGGTTYQQAVKSYVQVLNQNGMYVILDLHWNAAGGTKATGQTNMADSDHSPAFWTSVANAFKGNNTVIFDLYNEPHDISWSCWKDSSSGNCGTGAGMQQLVNAVRGTGATNVLMLGGLGWASDLSGWLANRPTDPLNNMAASWHMYGNSNCEGSGTCWDASVATSIMAQVPVVVGEFNESADGSVCGSNIVNTFMSFLDKNQTSYVAWTWDTWGGGCGSNAIITDYTGTPASPVGSAIKAHYLSLGSTTVISPTQQNPTAIPTIKPTQTFILNPTLAPTIIPTSFATLSPTANPNQTQTSIDLTIFEHGIGQSGDSINSTSFSLSNQNPAHPQINTEVQIFTLKNQLIASGSAVLNFDSSVGAFTATSVPISTGFPTGTYRVEVRTNYHLSASTSATQTITAGQENSIAPATLVAGDINNDNTLSILDYNIFIGCYTDFLAATSCTPEQQVATDLNDDGVVNEDDYNLFLRELAAQQGLQ